MWSEQSKEKIISLACSPAPWLEIGQAFLWFAYGLAILGSGGMWLVGEIYQGDAFNPLICLWGLLCLLLGIAHGFAIYKKDSFIRILFARVAVLFWAAMASFYLYSPTHKIGAIACLYFLLAQIKTYLWVKEISRRERVVRTSFYHHHRVQHPWRGGDHSVDNLPLVVAERCGINRAGEITAGGARTTTRLLHSAP